MSELNIQRNVDLSSLNTLAAPSSAAYFSECEKPEQLTLIVDWAAQNSLPIVVLGGGSNMLFPETVDGLVVHVNIRGKQQLDCQQNDIDSSSSASAPSVIVSAGAGENWHDFVQWTLGQGFCGLENLSLIPGSVGAAPVQNIGAYGVEVAQIIHSVVCFDCTIKKIVKFTAKQCDFGYRDSLFKRAGNERYIICNVQFRLNTQSKLNIGYPALSQYFERLGRATGSLTAGDVAEAVIDIRLSKLPNPDVLPNAGSFFKNPIVEDEEFSTLQSQFPEIPSFAYGVGKKKIPAAWLIDSLGWKGKSLAEVAVHSEHALVIVNPNKKPLSHVLKLASEIQSQVASRFGIELEIEPQQPRPIVL